MVVGLHDKTSRRNFRLPIDSSLPILDLYMFTPFNHPLFTFLIPVGDFCQAVWGIVVAPNKAFIR